MIDLVDLLRDIHTRVLSSPTLRHMLGASIVSRLIALGGDVTLPIVRRV